MSFFSPDQDSPAEELKRAHLQCYPWLNALKTTLHSFNAAFYEWKVRGDYNVVPKRFSENQVSPTIGNTSENDLKKKASPEQNQKSPQIMSPVAKKKKTLKAIHN